MTTWAALTAALSLAFCPVIWNPAINSTHAFIAVDNSGIRDGFIHAA